MADMSHEIRQTFAPYAGLKVVTFHKAWEYFADAVPIQIVGTIEPRPAITPSPAQVKAIIELMKQQGVKVVICETYDDSKLAQYVADQFKAGGFPDADIHVLPYHTGSATTGDDDTAALIVRWRAAGTPKAKPIMLMGHMDVVEAKAEDWAGTDPFKMVEKDGYYYGRATIDMKDGITAITQAMINLKKAGFTPKRDIVVLFTGDEETNGIGAQKGATEWLDLLGHPEFGLNADGGGGGFNVDGSPAGFQMQTAEKTFAGYTFTVRNRGGHSSKPRKDNAFKVELAKRTIVRALSLAAAEGA